ncbi:MAG: YceI family protein [Steroidobacteraceae bacterium]|jgi:polyisoprenoid-binding protein YceI|nr:YceI family protein [Steroidobacteraceae bacterium]
MTIRAETKGAAARASAARRWATGLAAVLALSRAVGVAHAEPARFALDPDHLTIAFLVEHIGYAKTLGQFRKASGSFTFDEQGGVLSDLRVVVETASVDTANAARDGHLRGKDFLDAGRFPTMTFTAKSARRQGERGYRVEGELELLGKRRPLVLEATLNKLDRYPIGPPLLKPFVAGASARGRFRRSDFGMTYGVANGLVGDEVELVIELEARRQ